MKKDMCKKLESGIKGTGGQAEKGGKRTRTEGWEKKE